MVARFAVVIALIATMRVCCGEDIKIPNALIKLIDQLDVPARELGTITALAVKEGMRVEEGMVLAGVDDLEARYSEERARVELSIARRSAESDVAVRSAERALATAEAELRRAEDARQKLRDIVTESEMERLRLTVDQARLAIEKAKHERGLAQLQAELKKVEAEFAAKNVARRRVTAPFPGEVVQIYKRLGDWVEPGEKLLRIIRLDRLRIEAFLDAAQAAGDLKGKSVSLAVEQPGRQAVVIQGKLVFVSPEIDPFNRSVRILAEFDNPGFQLQPGMRGTLTIVTGSR